MRRPGDCRTNVDLRHAASNRLDEFVVRLAGRRVQHQGYGHFRAQPGDQRVVEAGRAGVHRVRGADHDGERVDAGGRDVCRTATISAVGNTGQQAL
jgi:hypothetical protein